MSQKLTQSELKRHLSYDPETGVFRRLISTAYRVKVGDIAGSKNDRGYLQIMISGVRHRAHRLAFLYMTGEFPARHVDHINGDCSDNRWGNLRDVTISQNASNRKLEARNTSGIVGVYWNRWKRKWVAQVRQSGRNIYLGKFDNIEDAAKARAEANIRYGFHENHGKRIKEGAR